MIEQRFLLRRIGWINSTVPVFQAEFSPKATRGLCEYDYDPPRFLILTE
jgi:hypothetical protein